MKRVILKISGEALAGNNGRGINAEYIKEIALEIKELYNQVKEIGIIIGAGNIWRGRDSAEIGMDRTSADYMGMLGTILNSIALQNALESVNVPARVMSALSMPNVCETYYRNKALAHLDKNIVVILAGGTGNPYFSTDTAASLRAAELNANWILMAKNGTDGVYDDDPRKNKNAKRFTKISYDEILTRHLNVMDLTSATLCRENDIKIVIFDMNVKGNISKVITHPEIGTIITK